MFLLSHQKVTAALSFDVSLSLDPTELLFEILLLPSQAVASMEQKERRRTKGVFGLSQTTEFALTQS